MDMFRSLPASATAQFGRPFAVVTALSLGPLVSTSFARFAYALILPAMRSDLDLTYSQAGSLNTANALGYLVGSVIALRYVARLGNRRLFCLGMIATVLAMLGCGITGDFVVQLGLRAVAGVSGALVFISGIVLVSNLSPERPVVASAAVAIYFAGAGAGIVVSAIGIPFMLALRGDAAWREAWIALGGLSAVLTVLSISGARRIDDPVTTRASVTWPVRELGAALASYFMFGVGYIGYMTFIVASMVGRGASHLDVAATWGTLGAAVMVAPLVWRIPRSRWNASRMLVIVGTVLTVGSAIPLYTVARPAMIVSAFLFGIAMFSVPATITDLVKASLAKAAWGSAIAFFTLLFAVGQILGPLLTGWLADATHGLDGGLAGSTGVLLLASVVAMYQRQTAAAPMPPSACERVAAR